MFVSATDVAIASAIRRDRLYVHQQPSRLGGFYVAICDDDGLIEVANDWSAAEARVEQVKRSTRNEDL